MAAQLASLRRGELDVSFMREHPAGTEFDTMLVAQENLGILLAGELATRLAGPDGIHLNALAGLQWIGFPRSGSPAWYDELAATLRSHGIDTGDHDGGENFPFPPSPLPRSAPARPSRSLPRTGPTRSPTPWYGALLSVTRWCDALGPCGQPRAATATSHT